MIAVIIPTLNEEKTIEEVINGFPSEYRDQKLETYVMDGGSTDSTVEKAEKAGAKVLHQKLGGGKGSGMREALEAVEADIYVMIDGDGTYDPAEVGKILNPVLDGEAEHVIGKRIQQDKNAIPKLNQYGNKFFNLLTRLSTGKPVSDMLSGYRAFTARSLNETSLTKPGFGIETEMTFTALENHVKLVEVPIKYTEREGESKLHPVKDGWRIIKTIVWSVRDLNPLKFFSLSALLMFILAIYPAYLVIEQKLTTGIVQDVFPGIFAGILAIVGLQLLIFGMLADQIKNVEKRLRNQR